MKILKLIGLMLLTANFVVAQNNTFYGTNAGELGTSNSNFGVDAGSSITTQTKNTNIGNVAGRDAIGNENTFVGNAAGAMAGTINSSIGVGSSALGVANGSNNIGIGREAGLFLNGVGNTFIGANSGRDATNSSNNVGIGLDALRYNNGGKYNLAIGAGAGKANTLGTQNIYMGNNAGSVNTEGNSNVCIGAAAGGVLSNGDNNLFLGATSGGGLVMGTGNIFIGDEAGYDENLTNVSNQLYIQNSRDITTPLIYGDFATKQVGIGTSDVADYALAVKGSIVAEEVVINLYDANNGGWPDYVFTEDYDLMSLTDLEAEIEILGHLPGVPSAEEVEEDGHALGKMDAILLEKVEELTLHLIDMNKAIEELREENKALKSELNK